MSDAEFQLYSDALYGSSEEDVARAVVGLQVALLESGNWEQMVSLLNPPSIAMLMDLVLRARRYLEGL